MCKHDCTALQKYIRSILKKVTKCPLPSCYSNVSSREDIFPSRSIHCHGSVLRFLSKFVTWLTMTQQTSVGTTPNRSRQKNALHGAGSPYSWGRSTPAVGCSSCRSGGLGSMEHLHSAGHNSSQMQDETVLSSYGFSHNCLNRKVLLIESHSGVPGVLRQYTEKGTSQDNVQWLPKPLLVPSVLFCHSWNDAGICLCAHLTVHNWKCT